MTASKLRIPISHSIFTYGAKLSSKYHDAWGTTFLNNSAPLSTLYIYLF